MPTTLTPRRHGMPVLVDAEAAEAVTGLPRASLAPWARYGRPERPLYDLRELPVAWSSPLSGAE
ncbi:hypothetical protein [Allonocardiopsis opalescens]|uniref:Uncharacterized protein n=1 Tax=Allonocardiopsis opalescens TaxID=1144618 RepID=A0A2T0Q7L2_9ACTN|nr:hypothetical protein [Allonocardiopsis opalescens]PRX99808.1 hypothetical protein CLV72_103415 [Allonocardiopsis opalescens]